MHTSRLTKHMRAREQAAREQAKLSASLREYKGQVRSNRNLLRHADDRPYTATEQVIVAEAMKVLKKAYPGSPSRPHAWAVNIDGAALQIRHGMLGYEYAYVIPLMKIYSASQLDAKVRHAAGEILERYAVSRDRLASVPHLRSLRRTARGTPAMDLGGMKK